MAKASREIAAQRREQIILAAARRIREQGLGAVSVPALMAEAGMTHGGFYKHFSSKEALEAEACGRALEEMAELVWGLVEAEGAAARGALFDQYLSAAHVANPGEGCAVAALATDGARASDAPAGDVLANGVERLVEILTGLAGERQVALADFATLVGAVVLARATSGRAVSGEILAAARVRLG